MAPTDGLRAAYMTIVVKRVPDLHLILTPSKGTLEHAKLSRAQLEMYSEARTLFKYLSTYYQPDNAFEKKRAYLAWARFQVHYREYFMPRKQAPVTPANRPDWKGFLERRLSETELEAFDNDTATDTDILAALTEIAHASIDVKLSYSVRLEAFTATLVDQDPKRQTAGYALSSQDATAREALRMACYKHFVILEEDWNQLLGGKPQVRRG